MEPWEVSAREAIRATIAQYTFDGDRGRIAQMVTTFCEDGVLETGRDRGRWVGRESIAGRLSGGRSLDVPGSDPAPEVPVRRHHIVTDIHIDELTPHEAHVWSNFTVLNSHGVDHFGRYRDRLVPVGERWLFAYRNVTRDWQRDNSPGTARPAD